jgi:hypothetical protein
LLVHVSDGGTVVPAQLSWVTEDGAQCSVGFSPDMASCYGHCHTAGGDVVEVRGELDDRRGYPEGAEGARAYEFDTEVEEAGGWRPAGRLRVLIDDGGETPMRWVAWRDRSDLARSIALRSVSPSGNADLGDLVTAVWASAEHRDAGEVARNLSDASTSKWFAPHNRASLEFRLAQPSAVDRYVLTSANDAPDRDPAAWTLRGSADGYSWRTLDVRFGQSFADRHQSRTYRIAEPGSYRHYRLDITGNNGSPHLQLQAVRFLAGSGGFVGHRQRTGQAPVPYRGTRVAWPSPDMPAEPPPDDASAPSEPGSIPSTPGFAPSPGARRDRRAEWEGWQPGGPWLPLGGSLSMESLTSPSGRFTALHSVYDPPLEVRDNLTHERVWMSDAPQSSLVCLGPDGDLVTWDHHGNRVWSTGTGWLGVRRLEMRDSGELALTGTDGAVVWSSGIPQVSAAAGTGHRTVARGSRMRRGESLCGQTLTSDDGSTVLFHDGRVVRVIVRGQTSHWDRFPDQETVLVLDDDGFLRIRALDGAVVEQIAGPGTELVVVRGAAELRDEAGALVWASAGRSTRPAPVREPAIPQNDDLAAWFGALAGEGRGYCFAVVRESTPQEVLQRTGLARGSVMRTTWHRLQRHRDAAHPDEAVVAAIAVGTDVLLVSDDPALPMAALAPSTSVVALHQPFEGNNFWGTFSLHQDGRLVTQLRHDPRRRKGTKVAEVAAALDEIAHDLHQHELVFRTSGVVPSAAELGGPLLGGVLAPARSPAAMPAAGPTEPLPAVEGYDEETLDPLVVRTDFTDEDAWDRVVEELREPWMDYEPVAHLISDPRYADAPTERVLRDVRAALPGPRLPGAVFIADSTTMHETGHPLLAVSTEWDGEPFEEEEEDFVTQFRLRPNAAVEISTNLNLGNMDFEDFAGDGLRERMVE